MSGTAGHSRLLVACVAAGAAIAVASIGGALTDLGPWYQNLQQPPWKPPDAAFGPVWTTIFALAALSGYIAWRAAPDRARRVWILCLFALNGLLNVVWSLLFFHLERPDWAVLEVILLWLSVLALIVVLGRFSKPASWYLIPYLVWVGFAGVLNLEVVRLNAPFG